MIKDMLDYCLNKDLINALKVINSIITFGYNSSDILQVILNFLQYDDNNLDVDIIKIYEITSKYYINVSNGIDTKLQMNSYVCSIYEEIN